MNYTIKRGYSARQQGYYLLAKNCDTAFFFLTIEEAQRFAKAFNLDVDTSELTELAKAL